MVFVYSEMSLPETWGGIERHCGSICILKMNEVQMWPKDNRIVSYACFCSAYFLISPISQVGFSCLSDKMCKRLWHKWGKSNVTYTANIWHHKPLVTSDQRGCSSCSFVGVFCLQNSLILRVHGVTLLNRCLIIIQTSFITDINCVLAA